MTRNPLEVGRKTSAQEVEEIKRRLNNHLTFTIGKDLHNATLRDWYLATAHLVRDRMAEKWMETQRDYYDRDAKRVYYLSLEFLIGRSLLNSMINLGLYEPIKQAVSELGFDIDELQGWEVEAALGNGGLGRLAACLMESMASLDLPGFGYGIRYDYGMFTQHLEEGWQVEAPENWLRYGNPWEFERPGVIYPVRFGGHVVQYKDSRGDIRHHWTDAEEVMAMAYDVPVPGYGGRTVNSLRLWAAKSTREFDLRRFNAGDYIESVADKTASENLSKVLYPSDSHASGKELRFRQEYFFVSAAIQDILARFRKTHSDFDKLPDKVAIQLNDTHPAMAVAELQRILVDDLEYDWDRAWHITRRTCAYTNHTLLPEALETWPVAMFQRLLPRHLEIIYQINHDHLERVRHRWPGDMNVLQRMSLIDESGERRVRMGHLSVVGSHKVNGVAEIHTKLMRETIFRDFDRLDPTKITCKTNGITPRRWLIGANPALSRLITEKVGPQWPVQLDSLEKLVPLAEDAAFRKRFAEIKQASKAHLAEVIEHRLGVALPVNSIFDVQIKRIHEYKRQLLNLLHVVTLYNRIRANPGGDFVPRSVIISGKAAPGYAMAKLVIKLINDVADVVNNDPEIGGRLRVVFVPNYNVSTAEMIIPSADLSQQISTAGTEASGTGNMKLALNGALTIGTLDGANVEIAEEVGPDNMFIFGLKAHEVEALRGGGYDPNRWIEENGDLKQVLDMIGGGFFSPDDPQRFRPIIESLTSGGDHYALCADYADYIAAQRQVEELYRQPEEWQRRAILNIARMGKFSSDRTIMEYAEEIWQVSRQSVKLAQAGE